MSSNLRVDRILPSTGTEVGVGTATGSVALYGDVNVAGTLTYEDVTSVDSVGLSTFQNGIHVTGGSVGIGTDNPDQTLHLYDSTAFASFTNNADTGESGILFRRHDNNQNRGKVTYSFTDDALLFRASNNGSGENLRITSDGKVAIGFNAPAVAGLSISNSSTNRGFEFDTGSGFDSTSCIRAYDRPTAAYKSLGLTGSDIKFGINDVEKVRISSGGLAINKNAAADTDIEIVQSADPTLRLHDTRNAAYKADFLMAGSAPLIRNNNTTASDRTLAVQKGTTDHLVIEGSGSVRKPAQPRFFARRSTDQTSYDGRNVGGTWITYDVEDYDIGGNFATSGSDQGRFIAPVSGLYLFHAAAYKQSGTADWSQSWFDIDGSRANGTDWVFTSSTRFAQNSIQIYLTAGQKIGFHPYNNASGNTILDTGNHTWFKGCLLG